MSNFENGKRVGIVDYSKQEEMNRDFVDVTDHTTMIIVGTGGIGFWLGIHAAMLGFKKFILFDGDKIDRTNLNRIPVQQAWVNKPKVLALKSTLRSLRPDIAVKVFSRNFAEEIDFEMLRTINNSCFGMMNILFDCTDNAFTQRKLFKMCGKLSQTRYIKLGYEGYTIGAYTDYNVWIDEDGYETGYRTSKANSISSSVIASLGLLKALTDKTNDMDIDILKLVGGGYSEKTAV